MPTPRQVAAKIRFGLSELVSDNRHHEFEHLCRDLTKARLASNVLPPAGPVSAGGDQGRDFESFYTYLAGSLRFSSGFLALASSDVIACACTVQEKKGLNGKIKSDVVKICTQGTTVDRIYFFSVERVAHSARHALASEARDKYEVELQILDGADISDMLADYDVFWIAQTYLHLTESDGPPPPPNAPEVPAWYAAIKSDWSASSARIENLGDLLRIVAALRYATDHRLARADLPGWLALTDPSQLEQFGIGALQRARYDHSRSYLRGMGDLRPAQRHVRDYFSNANSMTNTEDLYDAVVLLQYAQTAVRTGQSDLEPAELTSWTEMLVAHLDALLEEPAPTARRCGLLRAASTLAMRLNYDALEPPKEGPGAQESKSVDDWAPDALKGQVTSVPGWIPIADLDKAMNYLKDLVGLLPTSPTFPIDSLSKNFDFFAPTLVDHPLYDQVQQGLDDATTSRSGLAATATRCRDRAARLRKAGRFLAALNDLHRASHDWWQGDTLRGALLTIGVIASTYAELGMHCAAKRHALFLSYAAMNSPDQNLRDLAPAGLFAAANFDYSCGAWLSFLRLARVGTLLHGHYRADPWNLANHSDFRSIANHAAMVRMAADHRPELIGHIEAALAQLDLDQYAEDIRNMSPEQASWNEQSWYDQSIQEGMAGPPFADANAERELRFCALGLKFTIRCKNTPESVAAAELFCTAMQIFMVELASKDPAFLSSRVIVDVEPRESCDTADKMLMEVDDPDCWHWRAKVPTQDFEPHNEGVAFLLGQVCHIAGSCSTLIDEKFLDLVKDAFSPSIEKMSVCLQHHAIERYFYEEGPVPWTIENVQPLGPASSFPCLESDQLRRPAAPGPGYDHDDSLRAIKARYDNGSRVVKHSLPRLLAHPPVRGMFEELLNAGWKEWHIVSALANIVSNHRMNLQMGTLTGPPSEDRAKEAFAEMQREEGPFDPSPSADEVLNDFAFHLDFQMATVAKTWGIQLKRQPIDPGALRDLLVTRYGYWTDDVEHAALMSAPSEK